MKEFLSQQQVAFTERLVDEDDAAYDELLALGFRTVPVTLIGDVAVRGFDPDALSAALASAGDASRMPDGND